jgi:phosphatidylinositol alpha-1,6-mannosyltransferase
VIGGLSGGTADAIVEGVTGLRVDGECIDAIAAAVIQLLTDQETARRMGAQGYRRIQEEFGWDAIVQRTRTIASTLLHASR